MFRYPNKRIKANKVYQELIKDNEHIHLNSTKWETLTDFIIYMGESGICKIEDTEEGWFIKLNDGSSKTSNIRDDKSMNEKLDLFNEQRRNKMMEEQKKIAENQKLLQPSIEKEKVMNN